MDAALVLGSGGLVGPAFHLATLLRLRNQGRLNLASVPLFIGTSGGAIVASLLASGRDLDELCVAFGVIDGPAPDRRLASAVEHLLSLPPLGWGHMRRPQRAPRRLLPDWRQRLAVRTSTLFDQGTVEALSYAEPFRSLMGGGWPERLRVCAIRVDDGKRVVFGPESNIDLITACAASCSVPGLFAPVLHDGTRYADGGFYSPTNADIAADIANDHAIRRVVIISPMSSAPRSLPVSADHPIRLVLHGIVATEQRRLRRNGHEVTVIEPTRLVRRAIGSRYLDSERLPTVVQAATS
jgi:NTE family protein